MNFNIKDFKIVHKEDVLVKVKHNKMMQAESGIITDLHAQIVEDREKTGIVLQIKEETSKEYDIKVGDKIYFSKYSGIDVYLDEKSSNEISAEKYMIIHAKDVLGKEV